MSHGLIDYLKAKQIKAETGNWPPHQPAFSEDQIRAVLSEINEVWPTTPNQVNG